MSLVLEAPTAGAVQTARPPYPGLRPFQRDEADLFFGRNDCIDSMIHRLEETRFLAVLGASGSGKSSLVRSGLFMHLQAGLALKAGSRWTFVDVGHPGQMPYLELARALLAAQPKTSGTSAADEEAAAQALRTELFRGPQSLVAWWEKNRKHPEQNLLLFIDQFEELFGYSEVKERDNIELFIDFLLRAAKVSGFSIYVVMTMRAEFLGGCTLFSGLAEQINESLNLVPRMTRDQCEQAIRAPARGEAVQLDDLLVITLLNDMNTLAEWTKETAAEAAPGAPPADEQSAAMMRQADLIARRADQLPLMQHVLNWMWTLKNQARSKPDEIIELKFDDYQALGGLRGALGAHALEVMNTIGDDVLVEKVFRALTAQPTVLTFGSAETSAVRRPRTLSQLAAETEASEPRIARIVDAFRAQGVSMLTPGPDVKLAGELDAERREITLSHECLIRQWPDLRAWIRDEAEKGRNWQELVHDAKQAETRRDALLHGLALDERERWWKAKTPTAGWAVRYGGEHAAAQRFLTRSNAAADVRKFWLYGTTALLVLLGAIGLGTTLSSVAVERKAVAKTAAAEANLRAAKNGLAAAQAGAQGAIADADKARADATRLTKMAELAKLAAETSRQQAAAATRAGEMASRDSQLAEKFAVDATQRSAAATKNLETLASAMSVAQLVDAQDLPPQQASAALDKFTGAFMQPGSTLTPALAHLVLEALLAKGEVAANDLDVDAMEAVSDDVKALALRKLSADSSAFLSRAMTLRGRAQLLRGMRQEALVTLGEANRLATADDGKTATPGTRLASAVAQAWTGEIELESGLDRPAACPTPADVTVAGNGSEDEQYISFSLAVAHCELVRARKATNVKDATVHFGAAFQLLSKLSLKNGNRRRVARAMIEYYALRGDKLAALSSRQDLDAVRAYATPNILKFRTDFGAPSAPGGGVPGGAEDSGAGSLYLTERLLFAHLDNRYVDGLAWSPPTSPLLAVFPSPRPSASTSTVVAREVEIRGLVGGLADDDRLSRAPLARRRLTALLQENVALLERASVLSQIGSPLFNATFPGALESVADLIRIARADGLRTGPSAIEQFGHERTLLLHLMSDPRFPSSGQSYPAILDRPTFYAPSLRALCGGAASEGPDDCRPLLARAEAADSETQRQADRLRKLQARAVASPERVVWTDDRKVALGGRDVVAAFGDGKDAKKRRRVGRLEMGLPGNAVLAGGVVWLFKSEENMKRFADLHHDGVIAKSKEYIPEYGGFAADDFLEGKKTRANLNVALIVDDRLYLLTTGIDADDWGASEIAKADAIWRKEAAPATAIAAATAPAAPQ